FTPDEDRTELTHPVIVVSERFWTAHLGADSGAVGREIVVNGHRFTLIGVAPESFQGLDAPIRTDAWVPLHMQRQLTPLRRRSDALRDASISWLRLSPLTGLPPDASGRLTGFLGLLLGASGLVLLIASVNVAAMLSARALARWREMAVRAALGAARGRLIRQLLTEILVLFALGAIGGMTLALVATSALERLPIPAELPIALELSPDPRVFAFALLISLLAGVVVGLAPARRAAPSDVAARLRDGSTGSSARRTLMGNALVIGQLALSLLLVGAGLFMRALQHAGRIDPGFDSAGVATVQLNAESWGYDEARGRAFFRALRERVAAVPGVTTVSYTSVLPLVMQSSGADIQVGGTAAGGGDGRLSIQLLQVDPGYFPTLRIPLLAGREITGRDDERAPKVAVVNETLARRVWPDGSALGRTFGYRGEQVTIVGIARDARYASLTEATPALAYFPLAQRWQARQALIVRSAGDPRTLAPAIQGAMRAIDAELPRPPVTSLEQAMTIGLLPQRVAALVTGVLGTVGLLLATAGLYGVIAHAVSRRTREIGIRLALGARRVDVLRMIVREGMRLTTAGVAIGLLLAAALTRLMAGYLLGVSPLDGVSFGAMSAIFVAVALLASWLPARRAAGADPTVALRAE
ncbi:MAG TPA: FtsX-like permease family protein, partial [Gemmatimonadaceae bacterium]|nr:FtsX-like permease family protein [Gemmatimonadaceae bacterium]